MRSGTAILVSPKSSQELLEPVGIAVTAIDSGFEGEAFLRDMFLLAQPPQVVRKPCLYSGTAGNDEALSISFMVARSPQPRRIRAGSGVGTQKMAYLFELFAQLRERQRIAGV